ncbi:alpha/beta fold hydrolase [Rubripirellula amarantea]|uniref:alpha/beta fold hydrolase n=1 Tax=Rubripirellula amarantea TaxID=2527999 RepID=UPI0013EF3108|nr:alpha/beta fold hydrolase [Rubripirellula amarantea]
MSICEDSIKVGAHGNLHGRLWYRASDRDSDSNQPDAVLITVHGLGDHSARFAEMAHQVISSSNAKIAVVGFDLPSHGQSPGKPGSLAKFDRLLADIAAVRQSVVERFGDVPQALLGHSMGGNLAVNYVLRQSSVDSSMPPLLGLVLAAPMLLPPNPMPRPIIFAAWLTGHLFPFVKFGKAIDVHALTSDPQEIEKIRQDDAMHSRITLYLATQLVSQGRWALDHAREVQIPTLVLYGGEDSLIDRNACKNLAIRIGKPATLVSWPETKHSLFHDLRRDDIVARLVQWLDLQLVER